jgi:hypothetical protein
MVSFGAEQQVRLGVTYGAFCRLCKGSDSLKIFYEKPIEIGGSDSFKIAKLSIKMPSELFKSIACELDSSDDEMSSIPSEYTGRAEVYRKEMVYSIVLAYTSKPRTGLLLRGFSQRKWKRFVELSRIFYMGFCEKEIDDFPWGSVK